MVTAPSPRPRLVLVGPPGSGKSTVGVLVAQRLGVAFADVDDVVEKRSGKSIADIFLDDGEPAFRDLERVVCAELLRGADPAGGHAVVALGGGSVLDPRTEADLEGLTVAFLDVAIADAAGRVGFTQARPLLAINPRAQWTQLMNERRAVYERVATFTVDTAGRGPDEVAADVLAQLHARESK